MTTKQAPIGSGFGERSTAEEVLRGIDLKGKTAIVTGGYSGIGTVTTKALVEHGARVIVPARRKEAAEKELAGTPNVEVEELDLGDLESVKRFADRMLEKDRAIDLLILNAGIMACPETRIGPKKWEAQFATNHLGHYALANRLWPLLVKSGARVVSLSSRGHKFSPVRFEDPMFEKEPYDKWKAYGQAKTANVLFAVGIDDRGQKSGVRAFAVHPGGIATPLARHLSMEEMTAMGMYDENGKLAERFKTPEQGAATTLWAATSPKLEGMGAVYCEDGDVGALSSSPATAAKPGEKRPPLGV
ncbi:MAG TPA: oxidoreductase, partial [Polyangiaceae bacterium]